MKLSLESLLHRLVSQGNQIASQTQARTAERTPTTIRLKPRTKHFLEAQAEALNTSVQSMIDLILDGVVEATTNEPNAQLRAIRERFFLLMQAHGLDQSAVAELMSPYGFTPSALDDADQVLDLLTPPALKHLADVFHVRGDWLRGTSDITVRCDYDAGWFQNLPQTAHQLISHKRAGLKPELIFVRRQGADFERASRDNDVGPGGVVEARNEPIGVVLRLRRTLASGTSFSIYQPLESERFERWNNRRCREQIKMLIAFCERFRIHIYGIELKEDDLSHLATGKQLPVTLLGRIGTMSWHPSEYASFAFEVRREAAEWSSVAEAYRASPLPSIATEYGAPEISPYRT